jgi:cellulose synthase/poly-beta-1,6-N-acetylglucosamine synthase-like glycosyltransferase
VITSWLGGIYVGAVAGIALFGMLGLITIWYYWKHREDTFPCPVVADSELPIVTVQLPVYNERLVVERLIDSAVNLDYPAGRLQIQVLDDSIDRTTEIAAAMVGIFRRRGFDIELHHRNSRPGFKAGALEAGLAEAKGEFIVVFDADFVPKPDFLLQTIPHFLDDSDLGLIQARWGHLNPKESALTAAQSIALDKHFVMEQSVRHRANLFPKFNGSAGIWRRRCLEEAGGWEDDTVCEDLCLSTRAILKGWQFRYLNGVVAPAELPRTISAYKNQQSRWAKGSTQCLVKFGSSILTARDHSPMARLYALVSMAGYTTHLLMLLLLLVQVPLIYLGYRPPSILLLFGIASLAQPLLFVVGQKSLYGDWLSRLRFLPALLIVAIGLAPSNSRAIIEAVGRRRNDFVRTPKGQTASSYGGIRKSSQPEYRLPFDWIVIVELLLALYAFLGIIVSIEKANYWPMLFMSACVLGFGYVAIASIKEQFERVPRALPTLDRKIDLDTQA